MGATNAASPFADRLQYTLINAGSAAAVETAVNGGSAEAKLKQAILTALIESAQGEAASRIKAMDSGYIAHKLAHAAAGCAAAKAAKAKCRDGAIGAAVGEIVGEALLGGRDAGRLSDKEKAKITAKARLAAGVAAALGNGDVNVAADSAKVAVENNSLSSPEIEAIDKRISKECRNSSSMAACKNRILAENVERSDKRSRLSKQDVANIVAVQNKYSAEAMKICKGNSSCATMVGNRLTYARLHCESSGCMAGLGESVVREASWNYGTLGDTASRLFEDFSPVLSVGIKLPIKVKTGSSLNSGYFSAKSYTHTTFQNRSTITDGKYTVDPVGMARHKPGTIESKSVPNKSLFKSDVDAEKAALDAARYADKYNLWRQNKAKVPTLDAVGYSNGKPTKVINVYRRDNGVIHATPGN